MNPLSALAWLSPGRWLLMLGLAGALALGYASWTHHQREIGREEVRAEWAAERAQQMAVDLAATNANSKETLRRMERQQENQDAHDKELADARADAGRNLAAADKLREQNAATAKRWRDALDHSPTGGECSAAGAAITVQADVLSRSDRVSSDLASYADAARAAGLKCERDYDALTRSGNLK